ncbi:MAG: type II toxin-antitoxin system Phd/YefM family antitoxin [Candidatus Methylomirabilis oxyfera]|nr:type II toxin-antitoxin system Phd/YefM family antitoxin [Candidatus Methylomirabilis oxyfera]
MKTIAAGKFKAQCLALLDEVAREHETILVTKRGKPVAKVVAVTERKADLRQQLRGSILREKDIINPVPFTWEAVS